jgi:transposase
MNPAELARPAPVPLRGDYSIEGLRTEARHAWTARQGARFLALAGVAEGRSRRDASRLGGMDRQTRRDWVHRFNAEGPDGLIDRQAPGPTRQLTPDQRDALAALIRAGPDPEAERVVRWRRVDLQQVIFERFGVWYHERHVSRLLHELGFSHTARPQHVGQDPETIETFKKSSRRRSPRSSPSCPLG